MSYFKAANSEHLVISLIIKWISWSIIKGLQMSRGKSCFHQPTRYSISARRSTEMFSKSLKLQFTVTHDGNQLTHHSIDDD